MRYDRKLSEVNSSPSGRKVDDVTFFKRMARNVGHDEATKMKNKKERRNRIRFGKRGSF